MGTTSFSERVSCTAPSFSLPSNNQSNVRENGQKNHTYSGDWLTETDIVDVYWQSGSNVANTTAGAAPPCRHVFAISFLVKAAFISKKIVQYLSHQIFEYIYGVLNAVEKNN